MSLPQLRVRTGFTFRDVYGSLPEVIERLKVIGVTSAAMVDASTWGHVRWEQAMVKAGLTPMFGMEIPILGIEGEFEGFKPKVWVLAKNTKAFYHLTSKSVRAKGLTVDELIAAEGVYRFVGGAVGVSLSPEAYDFIDVNPSSVLLAAQAVRLHRATGKPMVLTSYNDMPAPDKQDFAYSWEVRESVGERNIVDEEQIREVIGGLFTPEEFDGAIAMTRMVAAALEDVRLAKAPIISVPGDLEALVLEGKASRLERGHIAEWTDEYEDRMRTELEQIKLKEFDSYFLVVSDLVRFAKQHMLVGPARGSSAGSLVCYLTGITEVDPLPHKLLFQRFIDISRADLPDIDIDFADTKRYMVFDYLRDKYGIDNCAKLGNINTLQAASVMAQVGKKFDVPVSDNFSVRNALIEYSSADERYGKGLEDTFSKTAPGQEFRAKYPEAAHCMSMLELHPSHTGVHAAGIIVCNDDIRDYCTVNDEGIAQIDKPDSEYLNLLKIDALGLRTLGIIDDAGVTSAEELYSLKLDDKAVLDIINEDRMSGIFQLEGQAVRSVANMIDVTSFANIDHITSLARPGPLSSGMASKYIERVAGREAVKFDPPQMEKYLGDTYGVFLYQEQIMSVVKELGLFDWVKTSAIRKAMSGRKGAEYFNKMGADFVAGAVTQGITEKDANKIWEEMVTFGAWGFNRSHSVSYAIITYWTCWLKRYHKLAYAAACLRAAKDHDQTIAILREIAREGVEYTPIDPEHSDLNWTVADGRLIGGIMNAKGYGPAKASLYVQKRAAGLLTDKDREKLAKAEVLFADLNEAHTLWGDFYRKPRLCGVTSGNPIIGMKDCKDREECLVIAKLTKKVLSDENEAIRIKKRGGKVKTGPTQFIDLMMVDDSTDSPMRFRIRPEKYEDIGKPIAERAAKDSWFLVRGWKIQGIDMFIVKNIKELKRDVA